MLKETISLTLYIIGVSTDYLKADKNENSPHNPEIYIFVPELSERVTKHLLSFLISCNGIKKDFLIYMK